MVKIIFSCSFVKNGAFYKILEDTTRRVARRVTRRVKKLDAKEFWLHAKIKL